MAGWNRISEKALRFGLLLSKEIKVVHVHSEDEAHGIDEDWNDKVLAPIREQGYADPELVTIPSTYRLILSPLMDYILRLEMENPGRKVAVLPPGTGSAALVGESVAQSAGTVTQGFVAGPGKFSASLW